MSCYRHYFHLFPPAFIYLNCDLLIYVQTLGKFSNRHIDKRLFGQSSQQNKIRLNKLSPSSLSAVKQIKALNWSKGIIIT